MKIVKLASCLICLVTLISLSTPTFALPPGSYKQSCRNCQQVGNRLICDCKNIEKDYNTSIMHNASNCTRVINSDGKLKCRQRRTTALPSGTYKKTCRRCAYNGRTLACQCRTRAGIWMSTKLHRASLCEGYIVNLNGTLRCKGGVRF